MASVKPWPMCCPRSILHQQWLGFLLLNGFLDFNRISLVISRQKDWTPLNWVALPALKSPWSDVLLPSKPLSRQMQIEDYVERCYDAMQDSTCSFIPAKTVSTGVMLVNLTLWRLDGWVRQRWSYVKMMRMGSPVSIGFLMALSFFVVLLIMWGLTFVQLRPQLVDWMRLVKQLQLWSREVLPGFLISAEPTSVTSMKLTKMKKLWVVMMMMDLPFVVLAWMLALQHLCLRMTRPSTPLLHLQINLKMHLLILSYLIWICLPRFIPMSQWNPLFLLLYLKVLHFLPISPLCWLMMLIALMAWRYLINLNVKIKNVLVVMNLNLEWNLLRLLPCDLHKHLRHLLDLILLLWHCMNLLSLRTFIPAAVGLTDRRLKDMDLFDKTDLYHLSVLMFSNHLFLLKKGSSTPKPSMWVRSLLKVYLMDGVSMKLAIYNSLRRSMISGSWRLDVLFGIICNLDTTCSTTRRTRPPLWIWSTWIQSEWLWWGFQMVSSRLPMTMASHTEPAKLDGLVARFFRSMARPVESFACSPTFLLASWPRMRGPRSFDNRRRLTKVTFLNVISLWSRSCSFKPPNKRNFKVSLKIRCGSLTACPMLIRLVPWLLGCFLSGAKMRMEPHERKPGW